MNAANSSKNLPPNNICAIHYADVTANEIVMDKDRLAVRIRILELWLSGDKTSKDIAIDLEEELELSPTVSLETAASIIRRVCHTLLPKETRQEVKAQLHRKRMNAHLDEIQERRTAWMKEKNMFVWNDAETQYFMELLADEETYRRKEDRKVSRKLMRLGKQRTRPLPYNHELLSAAMNRRFSTDRFTVTRTQEKVERLRADEKRRARVAQHAEVFRKKIETMMPILDNPDFDLNAATEDAACIENTRS